MILTVDAVVSAWDLSEKQYKFLLVKRKYDPFKGEWAFPGGKVEEVESAEDALCRELKEETNIQVTPEEIDLIDVVSKPDRDPRGRYVSIVYATQIPTEEMKDAKAGSDAEEVGWFNVEQIINMNLAFDHSIIFDNWNGN